MTKVSVLMSVYNTQEEYLREAIDSILNQTYKDFEFVIVDDGSTNNAPEILKEYQNKDSRIKVVKGEHKGLASGLNLGWSNCCGEYIARMDSDDISRPNRLEKQVEFMEKNPEIGILGAAIETFPKKKVWKYIEKVGYLDLLFQCVVAHPVVMLRKSVFDKYNLRYNESLKVAEDTELWSRAIKHTEIANLQDVLLNYRLSQTSLSREKALESIKLGKQIKSDALDFLTKDKKEQKNLMKRYGVKKFNIFEKCIRFGNEWHKEERYKVLTLFGLKIRFKKFAK